METAERRPRLGNAPTAKPNSPAQPSRLRYDYAARGDAPTPIERTRPSITGSAQAQPHDAVSRANETRNLAGRSEAARDNARRSSGDGRWQKWANLMRVKPHKEN